MSFSVALLVLVLALFGGDLAAQNQSDYLVFFQEQHRELLMKWLEKRPQMRLATEDDCLNKEGLKVAREQYGLTYQPYYAIGDFNRDRVEDFAVVFINRQRRTSKFAVAVFNGPFNGKTADKPSFYVDRVEISDGGLVFRPDKRLVMGVFQSDDCIILQPRGRRYVRKDCL
jgi:hypothetical protein